MIFYRNIWKDNKLNKVFPWNFQAFKMVFSKGREFDSRKVTSVFTFYSKIVFQVNCYNPWLFNDMICGGHLLDNWSSCCTLKYCVNYYRYQLRRQLDPPYNTWLESFPRWRMFNGHVQCPTLIFAYHISRLVAPW